MPLPGPQLSLSLAPLLLAPMSVAQRWARVDEFGGSAVATFDPVRGRAMAVGLVGRTVAATGGVATGREDLLRVRALRGAWVAATVVVMENNVKYPLIPVSALLAGLVLMAHGRAQSCVTPVHGTLPDDHFGWSVAAIGDLDGDGASEVAIGAPQAATGPGFVRVVSGRTGAQVNPLNSLTGPSLGSLFGFAIASLADSNGDGVPDRSGDVDGDGVHDFVVGAPRQAGTRSREGAAFLVSGRTFAMTRIVNPAPTTSGNFGSALCGVGNCTGGAGPEFAIGAPNWSASGGGTGGRVYVYTANAAGASVVAFRAGVGSSAGTHLGFALCGPGDIDGNGSPDLLVCEDGTNTVRAFAAAAVNGAQLWALAGTTATFGRGLLGLGDLNADGRSDFLIGASQCAVGGCSQPGFAQIFAGSSAGQPTLLHSLARPIPAGFALAVAFGATAAWIGDLDGDAVPEVAVAAPQADPLGTSTAMANAGEVRVFAGNSLAAGGTPRLFAVLDGQAKEEIGTSLTGIGDLDGDGRGDLAAGSPFAAGAGGANVGRVLLLTCVGRTRQYGSGCSAPGSSFVPEFHTGVDAGPQRGSLLSLRCSQLPANAACGLMLGLQSVSTANFPRAGCTLLVGSAVFTLAFTGTTSMARVDVPVPTNPALAGSVLFGQWGVLGAAAPATVSATPGLRIQVR